MRVLTPACHRPRCEVAARGNLEDDIESDGLDDDGYGGHLPPDEMRGMIGSPQAWPQLEHLNCEVSSIHGICG